METYSILVDGVPEGPISRDEVVAYYKDGRLQRSDYIKEPRSVRWMVVDDVQWLKNAANDVVLISTLSDPEEKNEQPPDRLIECTDCGHKLSIEAGACPRCGAPNNYVHPEILRFLQHEDSFELPFKNFQFSHNGLVLKGIGAPESGIDTVVRMVGWSISLLGAGILVGFILPSFGCIVIGMAMIGSLFTMITTGVKMSKSTVEKKDYEWFSIDFTCNPPQWSCTDPSQWEPVIRFFNV